MQATLDAKRLVADHLILVLLVVVVFTGLTAGIVAMTAIRDDTHEPDARISAPLTSKQPAWRFAEMNQLPVATRIVPISFERIHYLAANELPVATRAPLPVHRLHFSESNQLPDGDRERIAPPMVTGAKS